MQSRILKGSTDIKNVFIALSQQRQSLTPIKELTIKDIDRIFKNTMYCKLNILPTLTVKGYQQHPLTYCFLQIILSFIQQLHFSIKKRYYTNDERIQFN